MTYLVVALDNAAGTENAVVTQANALAALPADDLEVSVVSVLGRDGRGSDRLDPRVRYTCLARLEEEGDVVAVAGELVPPERATELHRRPSVVCPPAWDPTLSALVDVLLRAHLPRTEADVVVTVVPGLLVSAAQLLPSEVALVHQEHRSSMQREGGRTPLLTFAPRADAVAVFNEDNAAWLRGNLGATAPRIVVQPNALPPGEHPRSTLERPRIVAAGRLTAEKRYADAIRAFADVAGSLPDWDLRILGDGPQRPQLVAAARRHGVPDRVELPGRVEDLRGEWAEAGVAVLTSRHEGCPLVVQEAMAAGVPVVAYDCPTGPRDLIAHGVTGLLVPPADVDALATALHRVATDEGLRRRLGEAAAGAARGWEATDLAARWRNVLVEAVVHRRRTGTAGSWSLDSARPAGGATSGPSAVDPWSPAPDEAPWAVRGRVLQWLAGAAARGSDRWWVLPAATAAEDPVVAVPLSRRDELLDALAADPPAGVRLREPEREGWLETAGDVASMLTRLRRGMLPVVVAEADAAGPDRVRRGTGVAIELWTERLDGTLVAPRPNPWGSTVAPDQPLSTSRLHGVEVPTLPLATRRTFHGRDFPVDVVYTWVDDADPTWQADRERRLAELHGDGAAPRQAAGDARYRDRGELRHSLRSLHAYAPWVRRIHLVTAGQRPDWLVDDPRIRLVDHREILPDEALPTFNSHAIESALHRIPDLAEHFVYFNDDVLLGRPVGRERFFTAAGQPHVFPGRGTVGFQPPPDRADLLAAAHNRRLVEQALGVTLTQPLAHAPHAHRVALLSEVEERFGDDVAATARSPFRSADDVSVASSLAQHIGLATGAAVLSDHETAFVRVGAPGFAAGLREVLEKGPEFVCLADQHDQARPAARVDELLARFYAAACPVVPPWERA